MTSLLGVLIYEAERDDERNTHTCTEVLCKDPLDAFTTLATTRMSKLILHGSVSGIKVGLFLFLQISMPS